MREGIQEGRKEVLNEEGKAEWKQASSSRRMEGNKGEMNKGRKKRLKGRKKIGRRTRKGSGEEERNCE